MHPPFVARHADCWDVSSIGPEQYRSLAGVLEDVSGEVGRDLSG